MKSFKEMPFVIIMLSICFILTLLSLNKCRGKTQLCHCFYNSAIIAKSYEGYVLDHGNYMVNLSTNEGGTLEYKHEPDGAWRHYTVLSNYINDMETFICPADTRKPSTKWETINNSNISYFINVSLVKYDKNILLGSRNINGNGNTLLRINKGNVIKWNTNMNIHGNKDVGWITVETYPKKVNSEQLKYIIYQYANTNGSIFAVP